MTALKKFFEPRRRNWSWQKKALFWGGSMFVFTQVMRATQLLPFSLTLMVFDLMVWAMAGIFFGLAMRGYERWWDARNR